MLIDFPTVNLVAVLMVILECGILGILWAVHRDIRGIGHWAIGAVAISAGAIAIYLRGILPPVLSVPVANIAIVTGFVLTRSEERRVVEECVSTCSSRWSL